MYRCPMRPVYHAGDMLVLGSQMQREAEKVAMESVGIPVYSPKDDKVINDKQAQTLDSNAGLAEQIVFRDTDSIKKSTHVVIEPQSFAQGTLVELGQIKAYNEMRQRVAEILYSEETSKDKVAQLRHLIEDEIPHKKVYAHLGDIRRTDIPEVGDRRSFGVNQYVYGVVLELTGGVGFKPFEQIVEELKVEVNK